MAVAFDIYFQKNFNEIDFSRYIYEIMLRESEHILDKRQPLPRRNGYSGRLLIFLKRKERMYMTYKGPKEECEEVERKSIYLQDHPLIIHF